MLLEAKNRGSIDCRAPNLPKFSAKCRSDREVRQTARITTEKVKNPLRFQGQYFDHETGLHYNRYRYYDPEIGRFISKDPIGLMGGLNLHSYAPNPKGWVDPRGLQESSANKTGDISVCVYYDEMAKKAPNCTYYPKAASICRGENSIVNAAIGAGISASKAIGRIEPTKPTGEILTEIRKGLVAEDRAAQAAGKINAQGCTRGNTIDEYHERVFERNGIDPIFYGGNLWPQDLWPNPVPKDIPKEKPETGIPDALFDPVLF